MKTERYQPDGAGFQFLCITSAEAISPQTGPVHPSAATAQFPSLPQPWLASPWHPDKCFAFRMSSTHHFCPQIQLRERLPSCPDAQAWHLCPGLASLPCPWHSDSCRKETHVHSLASQGQCNSPFAEGQCPDPPQGAPFHCLYFSLHI